MHGRARQSPDVARSQNRRASCARSISCDAPRGRQRSCSRVLRFRVVRGKRTALARLRRGGDCRRRHAAVGARAGRGESPMASAAQDAGRKAVGANRPAEVGGPRRALRACGAMAVAAARRAAWARLAHTTESTATASSYVGVRRARWRRRAVRAAAARTAVAPRGACLSAAPSVAKHVALRATAAALARARARRAWSQWRVRAAARGRGASRSRRPWPARTTRRPGSTARVIWRRPLGPRAQARLLRFKRSEQTGGRAANAARIHALGRSAVAPSVAALIAATAGVRGRRVHRVARWPARGPRIPNKLSLSRHGARRPLCRGGRISARGVTADNLLYYRGAVARARGPPPSAPRWRDLRVAARRSQKSRSLRRARAAAPRRRRLR